MYKDSKQRIKHNHNVKRQENNEDEILIDKFQVNLAEAGYRMGLNPDMKYPGPEELKRLIDEFKVNHPEKHLYLGLSGKISPLDYEMLLLGSMMTEEVLN